MLFTHCSISADMCLCIFPQYIAICLVLISCPPISDNSSVCLRVPPPSFHLFSDHVVSEVSLLHNSGNEHIVQAQVGTAKRVIAEMCMYADSSETIIIPRDLKKQNGSTYCSRPVVANFRIPYHCCRHSANKTKENESHGERIRAERERQILKYMKLCLWLGQL